MNFFIIIIRVLDARNLLEIGKHVGIIHPYCLHLI